MKRMIYAACAAATLGLALPAVQSFADTAAPAAVQQEQGSQRREEWMQRRAEIFDAFLVGYKASLGLTNDQEKNWAPFESALREAAKRGPGAGPHADEERSGPPSPIDRMRNISTRLSGLSTKLSALADAGAPLYASLDDKQKVVFDAGLRGLWRLHRFGAGGPEGRRWQRRD